MTGNDQPTENGGAPPRYIQSGDVPYEGAVFDPAKGAPGFVIFENSETRLIEYGPKTAHHSNVRNWITTLDTMLRHLANGRLIIACYFTHPSWDSISAGVYRSNNAGKYLGYDFSYNVDPVNQIPKYWEWMRHICTFAHEIDTSWSDHSVILRKRENYNMIPGSAIRDTGVNLRNQTGLRYGRAICGFAFDRVSFWSKLDPLQQLWRTLQPEIQEEVEALCTTCTHPYWLRQFIHKHDIVPWANAFDVDVVHPVSKQKYRRVPKIDKSGELWVPHATDNITTIAGNAPQNWWKTQMENYGKAVDFYDEHFGSRTA